jgi:DNA-binding NtrC family response regulator
LIADDDPGMLLLLAYLLKHENVEVVLATNGLEAIRFFTEMAHGIDAAILDVNMPPHNGTLAMDRMREIVPDLPVVLTSGDPSHVVQQRFAPKVPWYFLPKPFNVTAVRNLLHSVLGSRCKAAASGKSSVTEVIRAK